MERFEQNNNKKKKKRKENKEANLIQRIKMFNSQKWAKIVSLYFFSWNKFNLKSNSNFRIEKKHMKKKLYMKRNKMRLEINVNISFSFFFFFSFKWKELKRSMKI